MKRSIFVFWIAVLALALSACGQEGAYSGTLVLEGEHVYERSEEINGVLVIVDGQVRLEDGAQVAGPVFMMGGRAAVDGAVRGDISLIGGALGVGPNAQIEGDLRVGDGELDISPQAQITGEVIRGPASQVELETLFPERPPLEQLLWSIPQSFLIAGLAYLAARFIPRPLARVADAVVHHPIISASMGVLVGIVAPALFVLMAFTLILIPVTALGLLVGALMIAYGWSAFGFTVGSWLSRRWKWKNRLAEAVFLGTLLFMFAFNLIDLIPTVGSLLSLVLVVTGLGAVLLTRFGLREFVPATTAAPPDF